MQDLAKVIDLDGEFWVAWRRMRPMIQKALDLSNEYSIGDVLHYLHVGQWQGWYGRESFACTRIARYPEHQSCIIVLAGGDLEEIVSFEPQICEYAKQADCRYVEIYGRRGWKRALPGYEEQSTIMRKEV